MLVEVRTRGDWDEDADDYQLGTSYEVDRALFHWAPATRRLQIKKYGLRPQMRATMNVGWKAPHVCFADSPSWAWALSGSMNWAPSGLWDLWQTNLSWLGRPMVIPSEDRPSGIYEVRTEHRIWKRHVWMVGSRMKP